VNAEYKYQLVHLTNHVSNGEGTRTHLTKQRRFTFGKKKTETMLIDSRMQQTKCNVLQQFFFIFVSALLYMFQAVFLPIIRSS
jgi:hypothetical protein